MGERGGRERRGKERWKAPEKQKRFLRSRVKEALITHETGEKGMGAMDVEMEGGGEAREEGRGGRD